MAESPHAAESGDIDVPEVAYVDQYGDERTARVTDREYDAADLWEGVDYTAVDTRSELVVVLNWGESEGWVER